MVYAKPEMLYVEREKPFIERDTFSNVEQVGYVDIERQVTALIIAGERLMEYKRIAYEYPDGEFDIDSVVPDPTTRVGFDPADASYYQSQLAIKIKKAKAQALKEKEVAEKDSSVSAVEEAPSDAT